MNAPQERPLEALPADWQAALAGARVRHLPAGLCNHVYRVDSGPQSLALRLNNPAPDALGIDPAREGAILDGIADQPWAPRVRYRDRHCLLTDWVQGSPPAGGSGARLHWLAHALNSVHTCPGDWPALDIPDQLRRLISRCGMPESRTRARIEPLLADLPATDRRVLCHNDWHPGNLVIGPGGWTLLDWEFAGLGDPRLDIGGAINGFALDARQITSLSRLTGFPVKELTQASTIMKVMEIVWYAANPDLAPERAGDLADWLDGNLRL
ncbi:phosphotransferase [Marinobacter bohaiensis]|uniref:phosphotransferase n=1 Tax=Marinobacter bohaiensis TaxID=2201898 RepID=UPI000DAF3C34|nr:phosphotransferase [Marinobacter bohaiensis]